MVVAMIEKLPLVAVDANVLLDLADDSSPVWDAIGTIRKRLKGARIIVTSSVAEEVVWLAEHGSSPACKAAALKALTSLSSAWKFELVDFVAVGHGIIEEHARKIRLAGLIPVEE